MRSRLRWFIYWRFKCSIWFSNHFLEMLLKTVILKKFWCSNFTLSFLIDIMKIHSYTIFVFLHSLDTMFSVKFWNPQDNYFIFSFKIHIGKIAQYGFFCRTMVCNKLFYIEVIVSRLKGNEFSVTRSVFYLYYINFGDLLKIFCKLTF